VRRKGLRDHDSLPIAAVTEPGVSLESTFPVCGCGRKLSNTVVSADMPVNTAAPPCPPACGEVGGTVAPVARCYS